MKLQIDPDIAGEMLLASGAVYLKGFQIKEIVWNRSYDRFEVSFEKSPVDQAVDSRSGNKLVRRPPPTPSTPPFVSEETKPIGRSFDPESLDYPEPI